MRALLTYEARTALEAWGRAGVAISEMLSSMKEHPPFKTCGSCRKYWERWQDFVLDPGVRILGFQAIESLPEANLIVFEHKCGSSISLLAKRLRHILPEADRQVHLPVLYGTEVCREHCRLIEDLEACDRPCANSRDRRLIQLLIQMKRARPQKKPAPPQQLK